MKKLLSILLLCTIFVFCAVGFVACEDGEQSSNDNRDAEIVSIYNMYVAYAEANGEVPLSYEQWFATIKGEKGDKGDQGIQGEKGDTGVGVKSITIDENGNLILTMTDNSVINAGKVKDVHPHELKTKEIIEKEATCTTTGVKYVVCETCGELIKTIITDKAPHNYESKVTPATCTEKGYTTYTCKDCGYSYKDNYTDLIPHTYRDEVTAPTCTEQGYTTHTCTVCGHKEIDTYTKADTTEHNYVAQGEPYGNCALSMKQDYKCSRCSSVKTETITVQAPDVHNHLNEGDTCPHCGWSLYTKNGDSLLMKNDKDQLSAEFYGTTIYDFGEAYRKLYVRVYISDNVKSIGNSAFSGCSSLTSVTIPDSVTSIGDHAFSSCYSLTSIMIPDSVTSIGVWAFYNCSSLTSITIPDSVTSIGDHAFWGCSKIQETENGLIYVDKALIGTASTSGLPPTSYTVKEGTTVIAGEAFSGNSCVKTINLPASVKGISNEAFYYCKALSEITIPDSVTSIGQVAFSGCSSLTTVYYEGTAEEWNNIYIDNYGGLNYELNTATRYYYSETEPTTAGNYWHYDTDGVTPVVWG